MPDTEDRLYDVYSVLFDICEILRDIKEIMRGAGHGENRPELKVDTSKGGTPEERKLT